MKTELQHIHKSFGKVHANDDISLVIESGEILGILGENGAGKTTLMKILAGLLHADAGDILINGRAVQITSADEALSLGIGMLSQDPLDFPTMTIFDNLYLGQQKGLFIKKAAFQNKVAEVQKSLGFHFVLSDYVGDLSMGERQQLEILRLLVYGSELIILDEPTTGISAKQKTQLFDLLKQLTRLGKSIIFVTHKLAEVNELCQRTIVLKQGRLVGEVSIPCGSSELIQMMFGKNLIFQSTTDVSSTISQIMLQDLIFKDARFLSNPLDLQICRGEIIGLAGMEGSGQKAFLRTLAGLDKAIAGKITCGEDDLTGKPSYRFHQAGICFMPATRMEEGLVQGMTLKEHFILTHQSDQFKLDFAQAETITREKIADYAIRGFQDSFSEELSGGNQQRLLLAMLKENARLLLLENPTRGLDIESTNWMWEKLHKRCQDGASIIFASADLDELLRFSNRILVFFGGKISNPYSTHVLDSEKLGALIGGEGWEK
ncbi:MAG: ATP-binding cassette domain-containing protein [Chloroflexi bacterium]|nr:ATP-binding cassette domain-containing protein [Chloroflexota bacterium]